MYRILALLFISLTVSAQQLTVGTASAAAGQRAEGYIEVPAGVDAGTRIPVVVVRGARPGPTLAIVSGAHGTEYASIIAVEKLIQQLDPAAISGSVILVPVVNIASFEEKVPHVNPVDRKSMNRWYPGNPTGTQTDRVSYAITREVVDKCENLIDLHGGDLDESLRPYSYWSPTGNAKQDAISKEMNLAFGLDTIIIWRERPNDPKDSRYLDNTAAVQGKASLAAEAGYAGTVETDDVNRLVNGCLGVMRYLKMLAGDVYPIQNPVWIERIATASSDYDGIFYPLVKRGTYVQQGMRIGYITDFFGKTVQEATAPANGVVLYICAVPSMKKGGTIANIGVVAVQAP